MVDMGDRGRVSSVRENASINRRCWFSSRTLSTLIRAFGVNIARNRIPSHPILILSEPIYSHHIPSRPVPSDLIKILSCRTLSYPIPSHPIPSNTIQSHSVRSYQFLVLCCPVLLINVSCTGSDAHPTSKSPTRKRGNRRKPLRLTIRR